MILIAVLWAVYLSECFVRWKPGDWVFRRTLTGVIRGINRPDVTFWNERVAFVWTSPHPGHLAFRCSGGDLDSEACRERSDEVHLQTRWLRAAAAALCLLLLVVFPGLVFSERLLPSLPWFIPAVVIAWISTLVSFFRTHRRVHGSGPSLELALTNSLSPVSLIAAPIGIAVDTCAATHPAALAHALCDNDEFVRIARLWHFDVQSLRPEIERLADQRGVQLLAQPSGIEPGVSQYCVRCHATFTEAARFCADCTHVTLAPLKSAHRSVECALCHDTKGTPSSARESGDVRVNSRERHHSRSRQRARHARRNDHRQAS